MPVEEEEHLANRYIRSDDEWQQDVFTPEGSTSLPLFNENPYVQDTAIPAAFMHGRMVPITPPSSHHHSPMAIHVSRPENVSNPHYVLPSTGPNLEHDLAFDFPSQMVPWQDDFFATPNLHPNYHTPILDPSHGFGFYSSASQPEMIATSIEATPIAMIQGVHASHDPHLIPNPWDVVPFNPPPPTAAIRRAGPARSNKSKGLRYTPLAGARKSIASQTKSPTACWRCRKYRKACDDELVCNSCKVGSFRVWPPTLGCRRDNLEGFALTILPPTAEKILLAMPPGFVPMPSWRLSVAQKSMNEGPLVLDPASQSWSSLAVKVHGTQLYDLEMVDLLNILDKYQSTQRTKNPVLNATCALASASCDFYNIFVASSRSQQVRQPLSNMTAIIQEIRNSMARSLSLFVSQCVSPKRADWFPSVLAFCVFVASVCMTMDAAVAMPEAARTELWEDVQTFCKGLRAQLYPTALDLLRIRANNDKAMAPLKLNCWTTTTETTTETTAIRKTPGSPTTNTSEAAPKLSTGKEKSSNHSSKDPPPTSPSSSLPVEEASIIHNIVRNPEGMRLVGNDKAAFDGFAALQTWLKANEQTLKQGRILFSNDPFTSPTVAPISTLSPIFGL